MPQCIVIADDLTGANATGVLLTKINFRTYTVMNAERLNLNILSQCDCLVYPTDSRSKPAQLAYNTVYNVAKLLNRPEVRFFSKRIDSTLRGNLGQETDAVLDALDNGAVAIVVPCFPEANRILVGGYLLVNSVPLSRTEAAVDPKNPVRTSNAAELYREQSKYPVGSVRLEDLDRGTEAVAEKIRELGRSGVRSIVFDAVTQEDIERIADAAAASGVPFVAVDPGVFTSTVARKLITPGSPAQKKRILVAVGSVNGVAKAQTEQLLLTQNVFNLYINIREILESKARRNAEIDRVTKKLLAESGDHEVCSIIGNGILPEKRVEFEPYIEKLNCSADELSGIINDSFAEMVYRVLKADPSFQAVYSCGGDITVATCKRLQTSGLRLLDEVVPLAAYGTVMGGEFEGLKVITKGGMVGDESALVTCVRYLKEKLLM